MSLPETTDALAIGAGILATLTALALGLKKMLNIHKADQITGAGLSIYSDQFAAVQKQLAAQQLDLAELRNIQTGMSRTIRHQHVRITRTHALMVLFEGLLVGANITIPAHALTELKSLQMDDIRPLDLVP